VTRRAAGPPSPTPTFTVDTAWLDAPGPPVAPAGVLLGADADGHPVSVVLLRPAATRVVVLGGLHLAQQVVLRAIAAGARVVVVTGRPPAWEAVRRSTGSGASDDRVVVRQDAPPDPPPAGPDEPLLVVHDRGATTRGPAPAGGPWRTTLVVLPALVPAVTDLADDADLVLLTRMPPHEAELAGRLWRLTPAMTETLQTMPEHGVVALGRNTWRRVDRVTAPRETALIGPVRRGD